MRRSVTVISKRSFLAWKIGRNSSLLRKSNTRFCYHRLTTVSKAVAISVYRIGIAIIGAWLSVSCLAQHSYAQQPSTPFPTAQIPGPESGSAYRNPEELVRKAVENELKSAGAHFMFRGTKTTPKGSTTKIYVETNEATAGLAIAYNGKPLTEDQQKAEQARLEHFMVDPEELHKKKAQERDDTERTTKMVRALPDVFLYEYDGQEIGSAGIGHVGDPLVKLKFRPNPHYVPPSRVEEVLTGMEGEVLVDAVRYRIASIDGTLFKEVNFGWGILGHLDRGGHFLVQQAAVDDNVWEVSRMTLKFNGKILLIKNLSLDSSEEFSGFERVPMDLTFAQAVDLLKKQESASAVETPMASDRARR
jgi:predicted thioesterase